MVWSSFLLRLDKVLHADLTNLVKCYGISSQVLGVICSFICDRQFYVVAGGMFLQQWLINSGISHHSILGFTFFYYIQIFLMMLSAKVLSILMILLSSVNVILAVNGLLYVTTAWLDFFFWTRIHSIQGVQPSRYEACSYEKKKHTKIKAYIKSVQKEPTVERCLLVRDLNSLRSEVKGNHSIGREFQNLAVRGKKLLSQISF